ncbi:PREDICTED: corticotropin-releasing factor receptor 2-like [Thamnophis sirtalis]|uniref:Corticotropin-releasing factor receptor 2-like n=1 Tax=Thamnophis sirtalis TaxID=35019 RepID=A0A6I9YKF4_9SAUR|nr:PREDICTED: corticotropin-releasing factor receptor 2-like [Thamnophis sirtalis]
MTLGDVLDIYIDLSGINPTGAAYLLKYCPETFKLQRVAKAPEYLQLLLVLINFVFLFNIVRILMTKLRASTTSETIQYRKAVKATLVLLPLLGITYMLFFVNPGEDDISQIFFIYFNSFLQSFQGFFVSVFYCFLNSEVRSAVRKRWHRWQDHHSLRVRVARAMSMPTSPTRISFHSIKQTAAV